MNKAIRGEAGYAPIHGDEKALQSNLTTNRALLLIASLTFLASNVIIAGGFDWGAAGLLLVGCVGAAFLFATARTASPSKLLDAQINWKLFAICTGVGTAFCLLGGETHLFWADNDWLTRDSVLADVVRHRWPVFYKVDGEELFLRAPLGMYVIPGVVGHLFGLGARISRCWRKTRSFFPSFCISRRRSMAACRSRSFLSSSAASTSCPGWLTCCAIIGGRGR